MLNTIRKLQNGEKVFIVCVGDSITEQNPHVHGKLNYVGLLFEKLMNKFGRNLFILNSGIGGDSTYGVLKRLENDVLRFKPDLITLMIGINDSVSGIDKLEQFKHNLEEIIHKVYTANSELLLLTQQPLSYEIKDNVNRRSCYPKYTGIIREVAREKSVPLCDIYEKWEVYIKSNTNALYWPLMNDTVHPNENGHEFIAKILFDYLGVL